MKSVLYYLRHHRTLQFWRVLIGSKYRWMSFVYIHRMGLPFGGSRPTPCLLAGKRWLVAGLEGVSLTLDLQYQK